MICRQLPSIPEPNRYLKTLRVPTHQTSAPKYVSKKQKVGVSSIQKEVDQIFSISQERVPIQEDGHEGSFVFQDGVSNPNKISTNGVSTHGVSTHGTSNPNEISTHGISYPNEISTHGLSYPNKEWRNGISHNKHLEGVTPQDRMNPSLSTTVHTISPDKRLSTEGLLRVLDRLPPIYQPIIPYEYFNRIQSVVCDSILTTKRNIVISAPTVGVLYSNHK